MDLRKTSESVNRAYDAEGNTQERVDSISYEVKDTDGNTIGNAYIGRGDGSMTINIYGHATCQEGESRLKALLGIE